MIGFGSKPLTIPASIVPGKDLRGSYRILLDGVISHTASDGSRVVCCVGGRLLVLDFSEGGERKRLINLPSGVDLSELRICGDRLYALLRDGILLSRPIAGKHEWSSIGPAANEIRDVAVTDEWTFQLKRGRLSYTRRDNLGDDKIEIDVPRRARHLRWLPPYLAVFGPSVMWIALIVPDGLKPVYYDTESFPCPVTLARGVGEIAVADHLAGMIVLKETGEETLVAANHDAAILHPYAVAWDGRVWVLATENGLLSWDKRRTEPFGTFPEPVVGLHDLRGQLLIAQERRLTLVAGSETISMSGLPGYGYAAVECGDMIACVTDAGLYLQKQEDTPTLISLPGPPRAIVARPPFLYVATTTGLSSLMIQSPTKVELMNQICSVGEPVTLVLDEDNSHAYWGSGLNLGEVELGADGCLNVRTEIKLGVYPHALATSGQHLYAACGDGGLLWGNISSLQTLKPVADLLFATDVTARPGKVAVATAKALLVLSHSDNGSPEIICKLDNQADLCACTFADDSLVYVAGKNLSWIHINSDYTLEIRDTLALPFSPRRLATIRGGILACGGGGTLLIESSAQE